MTKWRIEVQHNEDNTPGVPPLWWRVFMDDEEICGGQTYQILGVADAIERDESASFGSVAVRRGRVRGYEIWSGHLGGASFHLSITQARVLADEIRSGVKAEHDRLRVANRPQVAKKRLEKRLALIRASKAAG